MNKKIDQILEHNITKIPFRALIKKVENDTTDNRRAELYKYITDFSATHDARWYRSGGCYDFAGAILSIVPNGKLIYLYGNLPNSPTEEIHALIEWDGLLWDIDGSHTKDDVEGYYDGWTNFKWVYPDQTNEGIGKSIAIGALGLSTLLSPLSKEVSAKEIPMEQREISLNDFIQALIKVESGGNDKAVGDNGKAKGCLQIWDVVIQDVNRVYGTTYKHDDAFVREKAIDIATKYLNHWGKYYKKMTGKPLTYEVLARIWNGGGPSGWKKDSTISYWTKVKNVLGVA